MELNCTATTQSTVNFCLTILDRSSRIHSSDPAIGMDVPGTPSSAISASEPLRDCPSPPAEAVTVEANATTSKNETSNAAPPVAPTPNPEKQSGHQTRKPRGLNRSDQFVAAAVATAFLALLTLHWMRLTRWGTTPVEIERLQQRQFDFRLDINSATWVEWTQLDGIGDALARRIVADREANGPFSSIDDLRRVKGIGPRTLEKIRPWLTNESPSPDSSDTKAAYSNHSNLTGR